MKKRWIDFSQIDYDPNHIANSELGSHYDSPRQFYREGKRLDQFSLEKFAGKGVVLDVPKAEREYITHDDLKNAKPRVKKGDFVFVRTGFDQWIGKEKYHYHPYLTIEAAEWLVREEISVLGVDTIGPDDPMGKYLPKFNFPVHQLLSKNDILILEGLGSLKEAAGKRVEVFAFPLRVKTYHGIPARVVVTVEK